jgi:HK97 family phage major capsid protein
MKTTLSRGTSPLALTLGAMTPAERRAGRYMRAPDHAAADVNGTKSVEELAGEVRAEFDKRLDEVKAIATEAVEKATKGLPFTDADKAKADENLTAINEVRARLAAAEQALAGEREKSGPQRAKSAGEKFVDDDAVKAFCANPTAGKSVSVDVKAIIGGGTADVMGAAGDLVVPMRTGLIGPPSRDMTVRDLITPGRTSSSAIQYPQETGYTNAAATVPEDGTLKPQSDLKFDIKTSAVTTIAAWVLATRQILDDVPMLQSYIDGRLRYGLRYAEELQLLHGDGLGVNLNGIYTQATAIGDPGTMAGATKLDVLRYAMLMASLAEYPATGIVLHPTDWASIELTKDSTGRYIIGDPKSEAPARVWGLPVVATQAMILDKFLVGAFKAGAQIFDRQNATVEVSTEDSDNFRKNLVTILAEERLALAVYRPAAFVKGDFSDTITALAT